ncbi:MAG: branched-chain amino acid ABC transporter permease [Chloroflexi bacterium]|nr:branched-chain amino acid ABC transporter permease [Chloroflexota bacterium]MCI0574731.1 branched-chain amino acid ABC transporter permease [Chloroflexota bacterium]MCI0646298.1 branched-chain amino acid ABC transporter permease [Chloroflexota bacterium]MCI0730304.1 branched-chain amino acid ABC transporter permease [Chloroflexota bacterium]
MAATTPTLRTGAFRQSLIVSGLFVLGLLAVNFLFFSPGTVAVVVLSGLYQGMLFFLVAAGMSIVFGLLDVLNLAQGSFFMLGAYAGFAIYGALPEGTPTTVRFVAALVGAVLAGGLLGGVVEIGLLRPLYQRPIFQIVLTFGLAIAIEQVVRTIYGPAGLVPIQPPAVLDTTFSLLGGRFETYRVFIIAVGFLLMVSISLLLQRTRLGIVIRAGVQDSEMVEALGINVRRVFTLVFILGTAVAALGGMTAAPFLGAFPGMGGQFLLTAVIVIVIGGMSSYEGTAIASILVGLTRATAEQLSLQYFNTPVLASISILVFMVVVLLVKPNGLFGRE